MAAKAMVIVQAVHCRYRFCGFDCHVSFDFVSGHYNDSPSEKQ